MGGPRKQTSIQDILAQRKRNLFIGRDDELDFFRRNLSLQITDDQRYFVFDIYGQGGVGKTSLARRFQQIAADIGGLTAWTDETQDDVVMAIRQLANDLAPRVEFKQFEERCRLYQQKRQELEADPEAPRGMALLAGSTLARMGFGIARSTPVGPIIDTAIDAEAVAKQAGEWFDFIARKLSNKDEIHLVRNPLEVLTPLWLEGLAGVDRSHIVTLFFDTYEVTGRNIDGWLRDLLAGRYGALMANVVFVISGRDGLDRNLWTPYESVIARFGLNAFTDDEARLYLSRRGVNNESVVEQILNWSARLPLLVATLAAESPSTPDMVSEPSGTAVERFLKWVNDPKLKQLLVDASLPRILNRDILDVVGGEALTDEAFASLCQMPFVQERANGWLYHALVREQMLRYKRRLSPSGWTELHLRLSDYYMTMCDKHLTGSSSSKPETSANMFVELIPFWREYCGKMEVMSTL